MIQPKRVSTSSITPVCKADETAGCPTKPGLSTADFSTDFRQGADAAKEFKTTTGSIKYIPDGAEYSITKLGEGPTIQSNFYIFFGYVEVVMKAAPGAGIVSSFVMQSDALDEIDWEWIGSDTARAQSEYLSTTFYRKKTLTNVSRQLLREGKHNDI